MVLSAKLFLTLLTALSLPLRVGSTPEATVTQFVQAWNARNISRAATMVNKANPNANFSAVLNSLPQGARITLGSMKSSMRGDLARVQVKVRFAAPNQKTIEQNETVVLSKINGGWKILPAAGDTNNQTILTLATAITNMRPLAMAKDGGAKGACLSHMKALSTALIMYLADHDDVYGFNAAKIKSVLFPYTKNNSLWNCPSGSTYSFNSNLANRSLSEATNPENTVVLYEGSGGRLSFRHDGTAAVGFADGSSKMVSAAAAGRLKWKL